ncbi:MAG: hypothetical protein M0000_02645 [Actinomycetota bacterium]|nr:hypothetical protein [Actinomycetota bacterium]MDA8209661.1 hypothetical protein [Actinomycetota bacterium]
MTPATTQALARMAGAAAWWAASSFVVGRLAHSLDPARLQSMGGPTRLLRGEEGGRIYERALRIRSWKGRLPEAGDLFEGGFNKKSLASLEPGTLARYMAETKRAELTHMALLPLALVPLAWVEGWELAVVVAYALAANLPFIIVQRYNRARLLRLEQRRRRRG